MQRPLLSIIVPTYNEREQLLPFLNNLAAQQGLGIELLLCDGGSTDGTVDEVLRLASNFHFPIRLFHCAKGRGLQMNVGARNAAAQTLLFLHIDSRFSDIDALQTGWSAFVKIQQRKGNRIAGHFSLKFYQQEHASPNLYYHLECKSRLERKECTHGDQGFMLNQEFFSELGPFDTLYPIAEDTRFAERVRLQGEWILFPATIETSARRFVVEGFKERQIFNALLMNFASLGWTDFFEQAVGVYATQDAAGRLNLVPYLQLIQTLFQKMSYREKLCFWYGTGQYIRDNAWQIPFYFDTRSQYRASLLPGGGVNRRLLFHDKWVEPLLDHPPARILAAFLTWVWFKFSLWQQQ